MSLSEWISAGVARQAHVARMRKIRIDDSTPSPPPIDLLLRPDDANVVDGCSVGVDSFSSPPSLDLLSPQDASSAVLVSSQSPSRDIVDSTSSPPPLDLLSSEDAKIAVLVSSQSPSRDIVGSILNPLPLLTMSDVFDMSSVSSCSGSSDSEDPVSRKVRKFAAKLQAKNETVQAKRERDARLMNCWLSTPKKSCQYLDLECAHFSTDGSSAYSTSNASVLTEGFIDDEDEGKENYPPDEDILFAQAFLPITARALNIQLKKFAQ
jgi:hypothetical protein